MTVVAIGLEENKGRYFSRSRIVSKLVLNLISSLGISFHPCQLAPFQPTLRTYTTFAVLAQTLLSLLSLLASAVAMPKAAIPANPIGPAGHPPGPTPGAAKQLNADLQ